VDDVTSLPDHAGRSAGQGTPALPPGPTSSAPAPNRQSRSAEPAVMQRRTGARVV